MYWNRALITALQFAFDMDKLGDQKGSFIQQTQYFKQDSRSGGKHCFSGPN
jgi:hypothetical protein